VTQTKRFVIWSCYSATNTESLAQTTDLSH